MLFGTPAQSMFGYRHGRRLRPNPVVPAKDDLIVEARSVKTRG